MDRIDVTSSELKSVGYDPDLAVCQPQLPASLLYLRREEPSYAKFPANRFPFSFERRRVRDEVVKRI